MNMEAHIQEAMGLATSLLKTVQERPWRVVEDVSLDVAALVGEENIMTDICWYCHKWQQNSPKSYARFQTVARGSRDPRELGLVLHAQELAMEVIARTKPKVLRRMITNWKTSPGPVIYVEGLRASDGSRVTTEDNALFNWAAGHKIVEWGDCPEGSGLHH